MAINIANVISGIATQGSADAFAIAEIATGLSSLSNKAFRLIGIDWQLPVGAPVNASAVEVALTRRVKTAMPDLTDRDVIKKWKRTSRFTTSGFVIEPDIIYWAPEAGDIIIVEDPIYLMIDSNATTFTQSTLVRIDYEVVTITEVQRLTLLARTINP